MDPPQEPPKEDKPSQPQLPRMQVKQEAPAVSKITNFVGRTVNGFEIQKLIGQGKFSFVFRAKRLQDGVLVALKLIKIFDMDNEKQRDNCLKEVQLHQSLDHPNIVKYLNWFIDNKLNELFIAVEWAEKGDLKLLIKKAIEEDIYFKER
jgi:NIMA (never in mitosis gene a)-related kinase